MALGIPCTGAGYGGRHCSRSLRGGGRVGRVGWHVRCVRGRRGIAFLLSARIQGGGVARRMTAQIRHREAQPLDHVVKHGLKVKAVRFLPEDLQEA